jgi:hypothetical protein
MPDGAGAARCESGRDLNALGTLAWASPVGHARAKRFRERYLEHTRTAA